MFIDQKTLKRVNIYSPYKGRSKLNTPEIRTAVGVIEIADPARGNDEIEYTQEIDEPPYIIITPKSEEQLAQQASSKARSTIAAMESAAMLPRVTREFMLVAFAAQAAAAGADPMENLGYKRMKEMDDAIKAERAKLLPEVAP
jgi:hypothetical protein